jgi:hypothetical protein
MAYVIALMLVVGVVLIVSSPLRRPPAPGADGEDRAAVALEAEQRSGQRIDLEAGRDAKYREIRDAELDHQTGKLSDADYAAIDSSLRAEAIDLLRRLDALDTDDEGDGDDEAEDAAE